MVPRTRLAALYELEMKHQQHIHEIDLITKDEESRRLRVSTLQLKDDNDTLQTRLAERDSRIRDFEAQEEKLQSDLKTAQTRCAFQEKVLKSHGRDLARLKTELQFLGDVSQESASILSKKLAISRELENFRPEIEHLRSQLVNHKSAIAEKLALECRVTSLEAELGTERRETQRAQSRKDTKATDDMRELIDKYESRLTAEKMTAEKARWEAAAVVADIQCRLDEAEGKLASQKQSRERGDSQVQDALRTRLEDAEAELSRQKKAVTKAQREREIIESELKAENETLQERIEGLKAKLRIAQTELKSGRSGLDVVVIDTQKSTQETKAVRPTRKRQAADIAKDEPSVPVHTPGHDGRPRRPLKKAFESSLLGDKSTFSITPFLVKSRSIGDDTVISEPSADDQFGFGQATERTNPITSLTEIQEEEEEEEEDPDETICPTKPEVSSTEQSDKQPKPRGRPRTKALAGSTSTKMNMAATSAARSKPTKKQTAGKIGNAVEILDAKTTAENHPGEAKKKKRKLLGNNHTIADEHVDDLGESQELDMMPPGQLKQATKPAIATTGGARKLGKLTLGPAGSKAFAGIAFSPLKRDRRGVHASFLA